MPRAAAARNKDRVGQRREGNLTAAGRRASRVAVLTSAMLLATPSALAGARAGAQAPVRAPFDTPAADTTATRRPALGEVRRIEALEGRLVEVRHTQARDVIILRDGATDSLPGVLVLRRRWSSP